MIESNVREHGEQAAFLWLLRDRAASSPRFTRGELAFLDDRVEAHLDGLRVAGERGREIVRGSLTLGDAGEIFAFAELALETGNWNDLAIALDACEAEVGLQRGLISALGWASWERVEEAVVAMLAPRCPPALQRLGIAGWALHRRDPGDGLERAFASQSAPLRARAARAAGELGLRRAIPGLRLARASDDAAERFWACWSLALLGDREGDPVAELWRNTGGTPWAARAVEVAARASSADDSRAHIESLRARGDLRLAIDAAAASGDPGHIDWLLACLGDDALARRAGLALITLTGIDLEAQQAVALRPRPTDEEDEAGAALPADPDAHLLWPSALVLPALCAAKRGELAPGGRYLLGKPIAAPWLEEVLATGSQLHRRGAAVELALLSPASPLPETRGPAFRA